jgi:hypothetical protein
MELKITVPNAFTINRHGLNASPFPFGVSCHRSLNGVYSLYLHPQRVIDFCDLLGLSYSVVVFGVDQISWLDEQNNRSLTLTEIATELKVECSTIDDDTIILPASGTIARPTMSNGKN